MVTATATSGVAADRPLSAGGRAAASSTAFAQMLDRVVDTPRPGEAGEQAELRTAAEQMVASALILPLLEEVRHQPLDANLFGSGFGQDAFRAQLDQHFADRIVKSGNFGLVDTIYQHVMRQAEKHSAAAPQGVDTRG